MTCEDDDLVNRGVQGDVWHQHWHRTTGTRVYDEATLLVQIRTTGGTLIASSGAQGDADGIIGIDTSASDFTADPALLDWETTDDTAGVDPDDLYVLEMECEIDGYLTTFYPRPWTVVRQYAIGAGS